MEGQDTQDIYLKQLKEVFDSCDSSGTGYLDNQELLTLCSRLQLEDQSQALANQLLGEDPEARVSLIDLHPLSLNILTKGAPHP